MSDLPADSAAPTTTGDTQAAPGPFHEPGRPRTFPCEGCGAELQFNIGAQSLKCPYCGFVKELELHPDAAVTEQDFAATLEQLARRRAAGSDELPALSAVRCSACGATVTFAGTLTSTECSYCGVPIQRQDVHTAEDRIPVDGVLPFMVDRRQARDNLTRWVKSRWFAPNEFKARGIDGRFNGVYLPYWTFDAATATYYEGHRGEYYYVTVGSGSSRRRTRRTRWYPASGSFQSLFDDILAPAATGIPTARVVALAPWPVKRCVPFSKQLLAGFYARTYDVPLDAGFDIARRHIDDALAIEVRQRIGGDTQQVETIRTRYNAITYKHLLLPVWMMAYRYSGRSYQVVINAGTGEIQGDRPYSWVKILLLIAGCLTAAVLLGLGFAFLG